MKKILFGLVLVAIINVHASTVKIESFANLPSSRDVKISPDGKYVSVVLRKDGEDLLAVLDIDTMKPEGVFSVKGKRKSVGKVYWVNNKRLIYTVTESYAWNKTQFENGELIGVDFDGSKHKLIFGYNSGDTQTGSRLGTKRAENGSHKIIDYLKEDKKNILIAFYPWKLQGDTWVSNSEIKPILYKLNVYTGKKIKVGYLPLPFADAIVDSDSQVRFSSGIDEEGESVVFYRESSSDKWEKLILTNFEGTNLTPLSFTKDNENIYLSANVPNGTRALYYYNIKNKTTKKLFHDETVNMTLYIRDFSGKRIIGIGTDLDLPQYYYLDKKDKKAILHKQLLASFKGSDVMITSATDDESKAIVYVYSDRNAGDYYLFETNTLKASLLLSKHPQIDPQKMSKTSSINFTARDGMKIRGYLTTPKNNKNIKGNKPPLVVMPHGGPHSIRDYWGYDWEVQLLASRGYAVLQVNFRGSGGFGIGFERAGFGNWGTSMQDDLTDGTQSLINDGVVDPERICIYGASYGGYAALMGAVREPDLYKCAIGSMGVYNLPMMFTEGDIPDDERGLNYLKKVLGSDTNVQKTRSPVFNASKIKAEVLLIHGAEDKRAPILQAESLMKAFDEIGKKYEWIKLNNEAHGYYDENNRVAVYKKILKFLDKNIGDN